MPVTETIQELLDGIDEAQYGRDMRKYIHKGIQKCYEEGSAGETDLVARAAIEDILGNFATVESTSSASRAYNQGHLLVYNNKLYRVKKHIEYGDTLTSGTNIEETNVGQEAPSVKYLVATISSSDLQSAWGSSVAANAFKTKNVSLNISEDQNVYSVTPLDILKGYSCLAVSVYGEDFKYYGIFSVPYISMVDVQGGGYKLEASVHLYNPGSNAISIANSLHVVFMFLKGTTKLNLV